MVAEWWQMYGSAVWRPRAPGATAARLLGVLLAGFLVGGPLVTSLTGAGVPIPAPHDDPHTIEWVGLLVDALYGTGVIAVATMALVAARRLMSGGRTRTPEQVRAGAGHFVSVGVLALIAVGGVIAAAAAWPHPIGVLVSGVAAVGFARAAVEAARDRDPPRHPEPPPAPFAEPVKPPVPPPPQVIQARVPPPRPFVAPRRDPDAPDDRRPAG
jgi:hypothetical protein